MKKFKSTWIMATLVAALAVFTYFEYKSADQDAAAARGEKRAFELLRDDIEEIHLNAKGVKTVLKKEGGEWKLVEPVQDLAESGAVEGFLFSLLSQKGQEFRTPEESKTTNWAEFGLEPAGSRVEVKGKGKSEVLEISSKNAFDGSYYLKVRGELLLGDRGFAQILERDPSSFRSRTLYRQSGDVSSVEVFAQTAGFEDRFTIKKTKEGGWVISPKPEYPVDPRKIVTWIEKVQALVATEVVAESLSDALKKEHLLVKPSLRVKLNDWELTVGQDKAGEVYLFNNQRPTLYKLSASSIEPVRVTREFFRDGRPPFKLDVGQARTIRLAKDNFRHTLKKDGSTWALEGKEKDPTIELVQDKLVALFQNISELEATEFVTGAKGFPKDPQVVIEGAKGEILLSLAWGDEYQPKKSWNKGNTYRFVRTNLAGETLGVPKDKLERLIDVGMVRHKEAPKQPEKK